MTPLLVVRWTRDPDPADLGTFTAFLNSIPADKRDRVLFRWPRGSAPVVGRMASIARAAGFRRVRPVRDAGAPTAQALETLLRAGVNEVEFEPHCAPATDLLAAARARGSLAHVVLAVRFRVAEPFDPSNPFHADELSVTVESGFSATDVPDLDRLVASARGRFRRVSLHGIALCRLRSLDPALVVSNALEVAAPERVLLLKTEDPRRAYYDVCRDCSLALACDGFSIHEFQAARGPRVRVRAFGTHREYETTLDARGLWNRRHPPSFLTGRVPLLAVQEGLRPAGRVAVAPADLENQKALIEQAGLAWELVQTPPPDLDRGGSGEVHLFFGSRQAVRRAAQIERAFVLAERGPSPIGAAAFAREIGKALGYPPCCIEAFAAAGAQATSEELWRAAHARSARFEWPLNCLDPTATCLLIPHIPCRFDCEASLTYAQAVHRVLDRLYPGLAGAARVALARPMLLVGPGCGLRFEGRADPNENLIDYEAVERFGPGWGARMPRYWGALVRGCRVAVRPDGLRIRDRAGATRRFVLGNRAWLFGFDQGAREEGVFGIAPWTKVHS